MPPILERSSLSRSKPKLNFNKAKQGFDGKNDDQERLVTAGIVRRLISRIDGMGRPSLTGGLVIKGYKAQCAGYENTGVIVDADFCLVLERN